MGNCFYNHNDLIDDEGIIIKRSISFKYKEELYPPTYKSFILRRKRKEETIKKIIQELEEENVVL